MAKAQKRSSKEACKPKKTGTKPAAPLAKDMNTVKLSVKNV